MILTVEQTKDLFRANKESIRGKRIVFRWKANRFNNQWNSNKLSEIGAKILQLENAGTHFSFSSDSINEKTNINSLSEMFKTGNIDSLIMSPHTPMTHAEAMHSGHYGSLD
jgi:hypothetical protein